MLNCILLVNLLKLPTGIQWVTNCFAECMILSWYILALCGLINASITYGRLGLERSFTSREALDIITSLLEKHGLAADNFEHVRAGAASESRFCTSFLICDPSDAWVLEVVSGKQWAAQQVTSNWTETTYLVYLYFLLNERECSFMYRVSAFWLARMGTVCVYSFHVLMSLLIWIFFCYFLDCLDIRWLLYLVFSKIFYVTHALFTRFSEAITLLVMKQLENFGLLYSAFHCNFVIAYCNLVKLFFVSYS